MRPRAPGPDVAKVEDRTIPGPSGEIPVRIYTPEGSAPFPGLAWFHGGGWVVGDLDTADGSARHLCVGANCVVVSVDYRLAPETKFPGAADDCYAATQWLAGNAASLNVDPNLIATGGDSAGGNLSAAVSLMSRNRGGCDLVFQLLVYPVTERNFDNGSYTDNGEGYSLTRDGMIWFWDHYLSEEADATNPYAAPMHAADLRGQPPALVITAEYDPLRDEGEAYAQKLREARRTHRMYPLRRHDSRLLRHVRGCGQIKGSGKPGGLLSSGSICRRSGSRLDTRGRSARENR